MSMSVGGGGGDDAPMCEMNTTPLIDVMLVLLIIFILNVPIQTHAVKLDLPVNTDAPPPVVDPVINNVEVDFLNEIYWNKQPVSLDQLRGYFRASANMRPEPELRIRPDPLARYETVNGVMAAAQQSGVKKMGFVGNEQYSLQ